MLQTNNQTDKQTDSNVKICQPAWEITNLLCGVPDPLAGSGGGRKGKQGEERGGAGKEQKEKERERREGKNPKLKVMLRPGQRMLSSLLECSRVGFNV